MSIARFTEYAEAFEKAFVTDDWSVIAPYFTEDAVYETISAAPFAGVREGRDAVLQSFKEALDGFDRRFASRTLELIEGPADKDGAVWIRWAAIYTLDGAPDLRIEGEETATFEGDRICRLEDRIPESVAAHVTEYMTEHGAKLG